MNTKSLPADIAWMAHAECKGLDTNVFFDPGDDVITAEAEECCAGCPVRAECLEYALALPNAQGVWAGETELGRRRIKRQRQRARRSG